MTGRQLMTRINLSYEGCFRPAIDNPPLDTNRSWGDFRLVYRLVSRHRCSRYSGQPVPFEYVVSGACTGIFGETMTDVITVFFAGVSALFVVSASALIAPTNKGVVAIAAFIVGFGVAGIFLCATDFETWKEFISAIIVGAATCYSVVRRQPIRPRTG